MEALARDTIVQLLQGEIMTARLAASRPGYQAWVGVVSLEKPVKTYINSADELRLGRMHVRSFEVPEGLLGKDYDIHEEELVNVQRFTVNGSCELCALLRQMGVDPAALDYKAATEYPL